MCWLVVVNSSQSPHKKVLHFVGSTLSSARVRLADDALGKDTYSDWLLLARKNSKSSINQSGTLHGSLWRHVIRMEFFEPSLQTFLERESTEPQGELG